jgi:hypothetical protein
MKFKNSPMLPKKYKVTKFIYETEEREEGKLKLKVRVQKYITVKSGISWEVAKVMRVRDHDLQIVRSF